MALLLMNDGFGKHFSELKKKTVGVILLSFADCMANSPLSGETGPGAALEAA